MEVAVGCGATPQFCSLFFVPFRRTFISLPSSRGSWSGVALCFPNLAKLVKERFPSAAGWNGYRSLHHAVPLGGGIAIALTEPILQWVGGWQQANRRVGAWGLFRGSSLVGCEPKREKARLTADRQRTDGATHGFTGPSGRSVRRNDERRRKGWEVSSALFAQS